MKSICNEFPILDEEYYELDRKFGKLCWKAAHELKKKNSLNNYIDDAEDVKQELLSDLDFLGEDMFSQKNINSYYGSQVADNLQKNNSQTLN